MNLKTFQNLPTGQIADLVRASGSRICVFPINGTRRWFLLEHAVQAQEDPIQVYMDVAGENHLQLYKLFFEHGVDTLLTPEFGVDLLLRGDEYIRKVGADGLARLASQEKFLEFYQRYDVRVHFYGEYRRFLAQTPYAYLIDLFEDVRAKTAQNRTHRLFIGVFGADATESVSEYSVSYYRIHGRVPSREELIEAYYGEPVDPVNLFIGFDKFSVFDYPLLSSGEEDLYFTVAPSPYMSQSQLRAILFDHLYTRRTADLDYQALSRQERAWLKNFYHKNRETVLGTGMTRAGVWVPSASIALPE